MKILAHRSARRGHTKVSGNGAQTISGLRKRNARLTQRARERGVELQVRDQELQALSRKLSDAQEAARRHLARELHDDIGQQVALLTIDLELLRTAQPAASDEALDKTLICAHQLRRSVHDLSHRLHPSKLRLFGLVPALEVLHREVAREDLVVTFTHDNVPADLSPDLSLCLYRIAQEALQNSVKYSKASLISVNLCTCPHGLELTIADDGVGFDLNRAWGRGLGLISMEERLEPFGASLAIRSAPGAGTRLAINVPLPAETTRRVAV
jgi:signal transduction histidine kinase